MKYEQSQGNYYQTSIYDFLQEEKSQEVAPPETLPQVDEAQADIYGAMAQQLAKDVECMVLGDIPSSALDAKESTEDTDSTLFSVGDCARIVNPYHYGHEDWDYLEDYRGKVVKLKALTREANGVQTFKCYFLHEIARRDNYFNSNELQKI